MTSTSTRGRGPATRRLVAGLALTLTLTLPGCAATDAQPAQRDGAPAASATTWPHAGAGVSRAASAGSTSAGSTSAGSPAAEASRPTPFVPTRVRIRAIDVDAPVEPTGLNADGTLEVPTMDELDKVGWYSKSPRAAAPGPAVLLGHNTGRRRDAVFARLHELRPGARIEILGARGERVTYAVTRVQRVSKGTFPTGEVYGDQPDPQLRLITCGGEFDEQTRHYVDNDIVFATLASAPGD